ncbi:hypothetical protein [Enhydrobacter sp.]|jgi:hypothetical protein|uniref:hypothetical protein n=1 Tax=Enhydrobacter sp. TaxID=1894999 RepID=UPI00260F1E29|nr:hypothetical protein [Enhydrobacter sp.]WIM09294.1 MAG: hypothetical protein OJF58_000245 [Enhydrobacter sp.]
MTIDPGKPAFGPAAIDRRAAGSAKTASAPTTRMPLAYLAIVAGLMSLFAGAMLAGRTDRALPDFETEDAPADVATLARRVVECRQWLNFAVIDEATDRAVQDAVVHLRCDALAADQQRLRRKYAQWPTTLQALDSAGGDRADPDP